MLLALFILWIIGYGAAIAAAYAAHPILFILALIFLA
jgi:hypothetical protein